MSGTFWTVLLESQTRLQGATDGGIVLGSQCFQRRIAMMSINPYTW